MRNEQAIERVKSFSSLERDWDSYMAKKISPAAIKKATLFLSTVGQILPECKVFPSSDGGVDIAALVLGKFEFELGFKPDGGVRFLFCGEV